MITGQVSQNVYDSVTGTNLLIPIGTKIIGEYGSDIAYGQERVFVSWNRLLFPDGRSITLDGMNGTDLAGYSGLKDQVNNHFWKIAKGIFVSSFLSASAQVTQGRTFNNVNPSFAELATQGVAREINQVGQEITRRNLDIQPTITIRPGHRFNIFVSRDIELS